MSKHNRNRRKETFRPLGTPPSQRQNRAGSCSLCGGPTRMLGFWSPSPTHAKILGQEVVPYFACQDCITKVGDGLSDLIERHFLTEKFEEMAKKPLSAPSIEFDCYALAHISNFGGFSLIGEDVTKETCERKVKVPIVIPREGVDLEEFDHDVCAAGLKQFLRPLFEDDWAERPPPGYEHVLVREMFPGVRVRSPIHQVHNHEMN